MERVDVIAVEKMAEIEEKSDLRRNKNEMNLVNRVPTKGLVKTTSRPFV